MYNECWGGMMYDNGWIIPQPYSYNIQIITGTPKTNHATMQPSIKERRQERVWRHMMFLTNCNYDESTIFTTLWKRNYKWISYCFVILFSKSHHLSPLNYNYRLPVVPIACFHFARGVVRAVCSLSVEFWVRSENYTPAVYFSGSTSRWKKSTRPWYNFV